MMTGRLEGRVAIVTGGAQGIGRAICRRFGEEGARVAIADVNGEGAERVAEELRRKGQPAIAVPTDVSDEAQVQALVRQTVEHFGRLDVLVNCAAYQPEAKWDEITRADWDRVMNVNVWGPYVLCRAVVPEMRKQGKGKIVNFTSGVALNGVLNMLHYAASKGGILALTRALSRELGPDNVCVNAVAPGFTLSETVLNERTEEQRQAHVAARSLRRPEYPEDLAGTVVYLASDDADFVTGQTVNVDGGRLTH